MVYLSKFLHYLFDDNINRPGLIYLFCVFQLIWVMFVHFNYSLFLFSCNNRIFWLINNTNSLFRFLFPLKFLNGMKTSKFFDFKSGKNHRIIFHLSPWLTAPSFCGTIQPTVVRQGQVRRGGEWQRRFFSRQQQQQRTDWGSSRPLLRSVKETSLLLITASHTKNHFQAEANVECLNGKLEGLLYLQAAGYEGFTFRHGKF